MVALWSCVQKFKNVCYSEILITVMVGVYDQMGSNYKQSVLPSSVGEALHRWHKEAKRRVKMSFSFGRNKSIRLRPEGHESLKDDDDNTLTPPEHYIMEDVPAQHERYNMIVLFFTSTFQNIYGPAGGSDM